MKQFVVGLGVFIGCTFYWTCLSPQLYPTDSLRCKSCCPVVVEVVVDEASGE